jgi:hypothetical protein
MPEYKIAVAVPRECQAFQRKIEAALQEEWPDSVVSFKDEDFGQCLVTSVTIPPSASMKDADSGEELTTCAMLAAAQEIVVKTCPGESSGF